MAITGGIEHAVLSIAVLKSGQVQEMENKTSAVSGLVSSIDSGAASRIKSFAENNFPSVAGFLDSLSDETDSGRGWKNFKVQFNPETISFQTSVEDSQSRMSVEENKNQTEYGSDEGGTSMSLKLIFDESDTISALKPKNTVQRYVEGLISAVGNESTRLVVFTWGNLSYEGYLRGIKAKYTMYDITGRPMRAEVDVTIMLSGISGQRSKSKTNPLGYWNEEYRKFTED